MLTYLKESLKPYGLSVVPFLENKKLMIRNRYTHCAHPFKGGEYEVRISNKDLFSISEFVRNYETR